MSLERIHLERHRAMVAAAATALHVAGDARPHDLHVVTYLRRPFIHGFCHDQAS